jgi:DUF1680 family protein
VLTWKQRGLVIEQRTRYPASNKILLTVQSAPSAALRLQVRSPAWAAGPLTVQINGKPFAVDGSPGRYVAVASAWKKGDVLEIAIPVTIRPEALHGSPNQVAFVYGPAVLAGDLGPSPQGESIPYAKDQADNFKAPQIAVPALKGDPQSIANTLRRLPGERLAFRMQGAGKPHEVTLRPFWELHYQRYNVYWTATPAAPNVANVPQSDSR